MYLIHQHRIRIALLSQQTLGLDQLLMHIWPHDFKGNILIKCGPRHCPRIWDPTKYAIRYPVIARPACPILTIAIVRKPDYAALGFDDNVLTFLRLPIFGLPPNFSPLHLQSIFLTDSQPRLPCRNPHMPISLPQVCTRCEERPISVTGYL